MDPIAMLAAYVRERQGAEVEIEDGRGWASWKLFDAAPNGTRDVYIIDVYVAPDYRKTGVARSLERRIAEKAKAQGATRLLGTVDCRALTRTESLRQILNDGFQVDRVEGQVIWLTKEIG